MTTFQEPQPQSRRSVRQSERGDSTQPEPGFADFAPQPQAQGSSDQSGIAPPTPQAWGGGVEQTPRSAPAQVAPSSSPVGGRRSAGQAAGQPTGRPEPLSYSTQAPTNPEPYPVPQFRTTEPAQSFTPAPPQVPSQAPTNPAAYQVRDFSPEARRGSPAVDPTWAPPPRPGPAFPVDLDYRTEVRVPRVDPAMSIAPELEQTLSRRELRAIQHAEEEALLARGVGDQQAAGGGVPLAAPTQPPLLGPGTASASATSSASFAAVLAEFESLAAAQAAPETRAAPRAPSAPDEPVNTGLPVGHWSTQLGLDEETQPHESTVNRTIGSGTTATHALVLPASPQGLDIRGPLTGTGEIMLTGSIDLPLEFSSTGATAQIEHHTIDAMFDMHDAEAVSTDSAPVRATAAVSTHNTGAGIIHSRKPKGTRGLTVLLIAASVMAVAVAVLLVAAFALNIF